MKRIFKKGIRIPEDIAVVGTESLPENAYSYVSLKTVKFFLEKQSEQACAALLRRIGGDQSPSLFVDLEPELIIRESSFDVKYLSESV